MNDSHPRLWQRQPGETAADFTAFAAYLRMQHRRSLRAVARRTGRSLAALRRLSARCNWPGRVLAFEERLADATQRAVDSLLQTAPAAEKSRLEKFRFDEFSLAYEVLQASPRWLALAANPRRRSAPLGQVLKLIELASTLGRLAAGMPTGHEPARRRSEPPGYWTQPPMEEALKKIYGAESAAPLDARRLPTTVETLPSALLPDPPLPPAPLAPPPDNKRDLTPHALMVGTHGLLCLQPIDP